jgi:hypothetical protein
LNDDPISELADGDGNVLYDARLSVADAGFEVQGSRFEVQGSRFGEDPRVVVYPNPAKDVLNVEFVIENAVNNITGGETKCTVALQMFTMQGILVSTKNIPEIKNGLNKATLDLPDLPNGAYMMKVTMGDRTMTRKVIVNR